MPKKVTKKEKVAESTPEQKKYQNVSALIQEILESNDMALQPFIVRSEFGDRPSVRLVTVKPKDNDGQETNTGTDSVTKDEVGTPEATQS